MKLNNDHPATQSDRPLYDSCFSKPRDLHFANCRQDLYESLRPFTISRMYVWFVTVTVYILADEAEQECIQQPCTQTVPLS